MEIDENDAPESAPAEPPPETSEPTSAPVRRAGRPVSITALAAILLVGGGAIEGYAIALTGDELGRQYSLLWALVGAALVLTAWALRGRRWWGAAAAIAVSVVGLFAGMYGVYGILVLTSASTDDRTSWGDRRRAGRSRGGVHRHHRPAVERLGLAHHHHRSEPAWAGRLTARLSGRQPSQRRQVGGGPGTRSGLRSASQSTRA